MDLLPGITGIQGGRKDVPPAGPWSDRHAFRSHCHTVARLESAKVESIDDPQYRNFYTAILAFSNSSVAVLLNTVHPIIAFIKPPREGQLDFEYIDCPKLAEGFISLGAYVVASAHELNRPLLREDWKNLARCEQKRVRYFRPRRVGDLVFNYWD